jgi:putative glycosyltransferase
MKISIVTTLYKSERFINEFYSRILEEIKKLNFKNYEIIFVDDGSNDNGNDIVLDLKKKDQNIKLIELSRNFGHHEAIFAGLDYSVGDFIYLLDVDLEDKPEWLSIFYNHLITSNCDVVYGKQKKRDGNYSRKFFGFIWYKFINHVLKVNHDENICTARLMKRHYVNQLIRFQERSLIISSLFNFVGFKQEPVLIKKIFRKESNYSFIDKIVLTIKFIVGNSNRLLYIISFLNLVTSFASLITSIIIVLYKFLNTSLISGWASSIFLISLFYFFISLSLSIISLYIGEINSESKLRPRYIIKSIK